MITQVRQAFYASAGSAESAYRVISGSQGNLTNMQTGSSRSTITASGNRTTSSGSSSGSDNKTYSSPQTRASTGTDTTSGPGYTAKDYIEDSATGTGPTIQSVNISESYHEDYGVYEESLNGTQFFYTTVGNGGITDAAVTLDLPAGMDYVLEKDGVEIGYTSGQAVNEHGSYVLKLTVTEDDSLPFRDQKIYKATFRFRIQDKAAQTTEAAADTGYGSGLNGAAGSIPWETPSWAAQAETTAAAAETLAETAAAEETTAEESAPAAEESGTASEEETGDAAVMGEGGTVDSGALAEALQSALGEGYGTEGLTGYSKGSGLTSTYDAASGYYRHELASGEVFYTDIPNGMLTNGSVILLTNDNLPFTVYKDGTQVEFETGTAITDAGSYLVFPHSDTTVYLSTYSGKNEPLFAFRIVDGKVNDLSLLMAPQDTEITSVRCEGAGGRAFTRGDGWERLLADGNYTVTFTTPAGEESVQFERDTAAPRFHYQVSGGAAQISYVSGDTVRTRILKGSEVIYDGNPVTEIGDPGTYTLEAYDSAGNISSADIQIRYRMNTAAILTIVLVVVLAVLMAVVVRRIKKQMKVV